MTDERIKQIMSAIDMPDNDKLFQALKLVVDEIKREMLEKQQKIDDKVVNIIVAAETLRDEVALFNSNQVRYVEGKLEVPVGHWAWRRLRQIATQAVK